MAKEKKHKKDKKHKKEKKHKKKSKRRHSSSSPEHSASKRARTTEEAVARPVAESTKQVEAAVDEADYAVPLPPGFTPPSAPMAPMTKEQWEAKQSKIRRVLDPETGRQRLIRGEGEVIEECVSRNRQKEINKQATKADGDSFQKGLAERFK